MYICVEFVIVEVEYDASAVAIWLCELHADPCGRIISICTRQFPPLEYCSESCSAENKNFHVIRADLEPVFIKIMMSLKYHTSP
jgi:hypothetical protein